MKYIALNNICKSYKQAQDAIVVLNDISFTFDFKKTYAITGASGSGKSTLIHILAGITKPNSGRVDWCNELNIDQIDDQQKGLLWNKKLSFIFQQANLINELTVLENVALKGLIANQSNAYAEAFNWLETLGLEHRVNFMPNVLSRGEKQRVAIARSLMCRPDLILADEPTASLDQANGQHVINLLITLTKEHKIGLIVSTHDNYVYCKMDQILTMANGKLVSTN